MEKCWPPTLAGMDFDSRLALDRICFDRGLARAYDKTMTSFDFRGGLLLLNWPITASSAA
jgi:hypothetical protein